MSQLARGNIGAGAGGLGAAAAIFSPEILGVITSVVAGNLAKSGFLNRGGVQLGTKVAGASKLKNPLLISAALAASLILPGLISANQTADRRRQLAASRVIRKTQTINESDVDRFKVILARFDSILSNISFDNKKQGDILNFGEGDLLNVAKESVDQIEEEEELREAQIIKTPKSFSLDDMMEFMGLPPDPNVEDQIEENVSQNTIFESKTNIALGNRENILNDQSTNITQKNDNRISSNTNMNMISSNNSGGLNLNLDILDETSNVVTTQGDGETNLFDLTTNQPSGGDKKFTGLAAVPSSVFVDTTGAGIDIDLIEASDALRTWAAYA